MRRIFLLCAVKSAPPHHGVNAMEMESILLKLLTDALVGTELCMVGFTLLVQIELGYMVLCCLLCRDAFQLHTACKVASLSFAISQISGQIFRRFASGHLHQGFLQNNKKCCPQP